MPVVNIWSSFKLSKGVVDSRIKMDKLKPRDDQIYEAKDAAKVEEEESKFGMPTLYYQILINVPVKLLNFAEKP